SKQQQHQQQIAAPTTVLQRRERLRIYESGEDVTPRNLVHPVYGPVYDRRTAFDQTNLGSSRATSLVSAPCQKTSSQPMATCSTSSFSSVYTLDEVLQSLGTSDRLGSSSKPVPLLYPGIPEVDDDAPSQYRLPRSDSREFQSLSDLVTLTLRETDTFFLFEMPQLTEDATTEAGQAVVEENEQYSRIRAGAGRKTVASETQTPQLYTKTRGTLVERLERKNRATFVNNWVMHDAYRREAELALVEREAPDEENNFKFPRVDQPDEGNNVAHEPADQLEAIGSRPAYEDAARVMLRILASKDFELAQKRFSGLIRQDPCDENLELVYGLELLWRHSTPETRARPVSAFRWNPANRSLLAVGYGAVADPKKRKKTDEGALASQYGLVMVWCGKNPTEPDRSFRFESPVSDLDWSTSSPNLLAVGFYDGHVRVIDVGTKQLTVVRESKRQTSPSYEPHWQVQWWPVSGELASYRNSCERLYTSNQDGRVCFFPDEGEFDPREILHLQRIEGKIPGIHRANYCLSRDVPISRSPAALALCRHPKQRGIYLVGSEEGCVFRCSTDQPRSHLEAFLAHDGPIYTLEYSPFCPKLLLSCGADWTTRVWAEGLEEPLLTYGTRMLCVADATWSPRSSTILASAVANEICIWDIRRKTHRPASVTKVAPEGVRLTRLEFTRSGEQIVAADEYGEVYVYGLVGMPLPAFDQERALVDGLHQALVTKPELLGRLRKIGSPFDRDDV
ncbi:WD repeat-containing protein 78-like, partial [Copidosoma floridanum]|uniref:WD repeat-containing protein 78-like n=1 Tax=Copidosoma floridanum TaxID=29053 RepID=UPI0006C9B19C